MYHAVNSDDFGERFRTSVWKPLFGPNIGGAPSEHTPQIFSHLRFLHLKDYVIFSIASTNFVFASNAVQNKNSSFMLVFVKYL